MKYDKNAILNTASNLRSKASGLAEIKNKLSRTSPIKCSPSFYSKRSSLVQRLGNVQNRITNLSDEISKAANKMSSDDVQNARYIREAFQEEASFAPFRFGALPVFDRDLGKGGVYGNTLVTSQVTMTNYSPMALGKAKSSKTPWYKKVWNDTKQFFSDASDWIGDRVDDYIEHEKAKAKYLWDSVVVFVLGDYSDKSPTALSFVGNIVAGIFDVDLPLDIRDLAHDIQHWGEGEHFGINFALDVMAVFPIVGAFKNVKYADDIADGVKDLGKIADIADTVSDAGKTADNMGDALDGAKDLGKAVGGAAEAGKVADNVSDAADNAKDLGKAADNVGDTGKAANQAADFIEEARKAAKGYTIDDARFSHIIGEHGPSSTLPNKSKFLDNFDIKNGIDETLLDESSSILKNTHNRPGYIFIKTFSEPIGKAADGTDLYKLKVVLRETGEVWTSYPMK